MDEKRRQEIERLKPWQELAAGGVIEDAGNSAEYCTGEWAPSSRVKWIPEKCKQCMLCWPVCPDLAVIAEDGEMKGIDVDHCKNCGMCVKACPFGALEMEEIPETEDKFKK